MEGSEQQHTLTVPWVDPTSRSTLGRGNLQHKSIGARKFGIFFLDPPGGSGLLGFWEEPLSLRSVIAEGMQEAHFEIFSPLYLETSWVQSVPFSSRASPNATQNKP